MTQNARAPQGKIVRSTLSVVNGGAKSSSSSSAPASSPKPLPGVFRAVLGWGIFIGAATWSSQELRPATQEDLWVKQFSYQAEEIASTFESRLLPLENDDIEFLPPKNVVAPVVKSGTNFNKNLLPAPPPRIKADDYVQEFLFKLIKRASPKRKDAHGVARQIVHESRVQGYDPLFVAAVIRSESAFNAIARSNKGAQGLMQIMPDTGRWLTRLPTLDGITPGRLTDADYNVKLGITYLKHLEELYSGNRLLVLIAYNWGPGRVEGALRGLRRVPGEVMQYAVKILNDYRRWRDDYRSV